MDWFGLAIEKNKEPRLRIFLLLAFSENENTDGS